MLSMIFLAVSGLGSFICLVIVLRKLFAQEGTVKGLLGLFCALYAYAWGWVNLGEQELMDVMFLWTIAMLLGVVANLMVASPSF